MAIRDDSYSSADEVKAFVRHLLNGQPTFNSTTQPSLPELEKFIDRASGVLNLALANFGFAASAIHANSTAKLACDDWVTARAAEYAELTHRGSGYSDGEGSRTGTFKGLHSSADRFVKANMPGFIRLGVKQSYKSSDGLKYTGLDAPELRADPANTALEQPFAKRGQFDNED